MPRPTETTPLPGGGGLLSRSFLALLVTQFLVAWNDSMFRWLIVPIGKDLIGTDRALALGGALFLLPFVLFTAVAGYLADRYSKRGVMVGCKVAEFVVMAGGIVAILSGNVVWMLVVLFAMGTQSAIFSPSKFGSIPEIVRHDRISAANGWIGMSTMAAVILGTVAGGYLYDWTTLQPEGANAVAEAPGQYRWWISAVALLGVAGLGWLASLFIGRLPPANPSRSFPRNPAGQTGRDLAALIASRPLLIAALGSAFFWSMGVLVQLNIDKFARPDLVEDQQYVGYLLAIMTLGIGLGSVLAGQASRGHVEVGLVPFGALGMVLALVLLRTVPPGDGQPFSGPYLWAGGWLLGLGLAAGLYDIPLLAFLQDRAPATSRGRVLAAYNFLSFSGMLIASFVFWGLATPLALSARQIFLVCGLVMAGVAGLAFWLVPLAATRVVFGMVIRLLYRIRVRGLENVPRQSGAMLVCNHISWLDGILFGYLCPRRIYLLADVSNLKAPFIRRLVKDGEVIQFSPERRRSVIQAVREVRRRLEQGQLIGIFAEGGISRTGQIAGFQAGFLTMLKGTGAPVVPVSLYGLWGSIFSFSGGRFFTKWPHLRRLRISVDFGPPIPQPTDVQAVRQAVQFLATQASLRPEHQPLAPARQLLRNGRRDAWRTKVADATGQQLSGPRLLTRALLVRRLLRRSLPDDETVLGIALRPSLAAVIANAAAALDRRVTVNLPVDLPSDQVRQRLQQAGGRWLLTSRQETSRNGVAPSDEYTWYWEDGIARASAADRLVAWVQARLLPAACSERLLGLQRIRPEDPLTIFWTEGSDGVERGVELSQRNIAANAQACRETLQVGRQDVVLGVRPFWSADGFTLTLWATLLGRHRAVFVARAEEEEPLARLCHQYRPTILLATPHLLQHDLQNVSPDSFRSLQVVMTCENGLTPQTLDGFEARFGVRPHTGYGQVELSAVASLNVPPRHNGQWQPAAREGSAGWPLPAVTARIVDPETGCDRPVNHEGLLLVAGPNVMRGYLPNAQPIESPVQDGWFHTGRRARIDADGFLHLVPEPVECPDG